MVSEFYNFIDFIAKQMTYRYLKDTIEHRIISSNLRIRPRSAGLKNSKRFLARVSVGEMLFPFYFRSGTDKIDEKRLT